MSFIDGLVRDYLRRTYPGREFSGVRADADTGDYIVYELTGRGQNLELLRAARIDPRILSRHPTPQAAWEVCRLLDAAFDLRSDAERLPWQLFADYPEAS